MLFCYPIDYCATISIFGCIFIVSREISCI